MALHGVCTISTHFYPWAGGAEKQAERLSTWLVQNGVPVMVITRHFGDLPEYEVRNGIEIYRVKTASGKVLGALSFLWNGVRVMLKHRNKFNVIHSHQIYSPTTIGWIVSRITGAALVVNLHLGGAQGDIQRLMRNKRVGGFRLNILKRDAGAFIAISQEILKELRDHGVPEDKIRFLVNAVDPAEFVPVEAAQKATLRQKLGLPAETPIAVFVGRLVQIKGVQTLLKAWEHVPQPAHLVVIGTGELEGELQAQAAENLAGRVTFTGKKDNISEYLQAVDAWTLPSFGEGLPVSLLEAMSSGLPVVTTPVGAIPQIIQDGENGLLVNSGDVEGLAQALTTALSDSPATKQLGQRARDLVIEQYSIESIGQSYLDLFKQLTS